jgi:hypothetical protein
VGDNVLGRVNNWPLHRPESACFISRWGSHWPRLPSTGAKPDPCGILEYPVNCLLTVRWERLQSTESHRDQKPLETCEALFTSRRQEPRLPLSECSAAKSRTGSRVVESCSCRGYHISNQVQFQTACSDPNASELCAAFIRPCHLRLRNTATARLEARVILPTPRYHTTASIPNLLVWLKHDTDWPRPPPSVRVDPPRAVRPWMMPSCGRELSLAT